MLILRRKPTVTNSEGVQEISSEDSKNSNGDNIINKKHDFERGKKGLSLYSVIVY